MVRRVFASDGLQGPEQMIGPLLQLPQHQGHSAPAHADDSLVGWVQDTLLNVG